jgi:hypothetical protein
LKVLRPSPSGIETNCKNIRREKVEEAVQEVCYSLDLCV